MSKRLFGWVAILFIFPFLVVCGEAWGTQTAYVSNSNGNEILKVVKGETTTVTVIFDGSSDGTPEVPEGIVYGPDGKIYFCDTTHNQIFRVDPNAETLPAAAELLYSPTETNPPLRPEGPVFLGNDLYFNTASPHHSGIWRITNAPAKSGLHSADVEHVMSESVTGSSFGEGLVFTATGDLLIVDRSGNRVLKSSPGSIPPYSSVSALVTSELSDPIGVAVTRGGDIFVANAGSNDIKHFTSSGGSATGGTLSFGCDIPAFMKFDSDGNLFVATFRTTCGDPPPSETTGNTGKLWKVNTSVPSKTLITALPCAGENCTPPAVGVALPPTSTTLGPHHYAAATNVSFTFDFLSDSYTLTFDQVFGEGFDVSVTRAEKLQSEETSHLSPDETAFLYPYDGGFAVEYDVLIPEGASFKTPAGVHLLIHFQNTGKTFDPVVGHIPDGSTTGLFEDITTNFSPEPTGAGTSDGGSPFLVINKNLKHANAVFCGFNSPVPPGLVHKGQGLPVKIVIRDGNCQTGAFITDVTEHISVTDSNDVFQMVTPAGGSNTGNLFRPAGHQLIYNLKVNFGPGTFTIIVWGDGASPGAVQIKVVP